MMWLFYVLCFLTPSSPPPLIFLNTLTFPTLVCVRVRMWSPKNGPLQPAWLFENPSFLQHPPSHLKHLSLLAVSSPISSLPCAQKNLTAWCRPRMRREPSWLHNHSQIVPNQIIKSHIQGLNARPPFPTHLTSAVGHIKVGLEVL